MYLCVCKECKKMFQYFMRTNICADCRKDERSSISRIRQYLDKCPNSNAMQVSEALGIPIYEITDLIDDGSLHVVQNKLRGV